MEPRYTLAEARRIIKREECNFHGHQFEVQSTRNIPVGIHCPNCGDSWRVFRPVEQPTVEVRNIDAPTEVLPKQNRF